MFKYILKKEFLLISRDIHALLVLFIMPTLFILIMSLALKNTYSHNIDIKLKVGIISEVNKDTKYINNYLNKNKLFDSIIINDSNLKQLIYTKKFDFIIKLSRDFKAEIQKNTKKFFINVHSKPDANYQNYLILKNLLIDSISKQLMKDYFHKNNLDANILLNSNLTIENFYVYKKSDFEVKLNSVQQSVPAWLVFSMFFILIPISNTFINEKNFGTLSRIRSINVSLIPILLGKIIPYFIINQIQVLLMILVGIYIVPLLGGDKFVVNGNYMLIFFMTCSVSLAAISFALLIANISKTTEEASSIGGISNIILAALGGIMVPKFVMPEFMQNITEYSPMSWGLEGLLEIFVRGGTFSDISNYIIYLLSFAFVSLTFAYILLKKKDN